MLTWIKDQHNSNRRSCLFVVGSCLASERLPMETACPGLNLAKMHAETQYLATCLALAFTKRMGPNNLKLQPQS